jgi:hypothetical protein
MKLFLKKNQEEVKGNIFRKSQILYSLSARVDLNDDEIELMNKYKLKSEILSTIQEDDEHTHNLTMEMLIMGYNFKFEEIYRLLVIEQEIRKSCQVFKTYMEVRKNFYGEEIVEY